MYAAVGRSTGSVKPNAAIRALLTSTALVRCPRRHIAEQARRVAARTAPPAALRLSTRPAAATAAHQPQRLGQSFSLAARAAQRVSDVAAAHGSLRPSARHFTSLGAALQRASAGDAAARRPTVGWRAFASGPAAALRRLEATANARPGDAAAQLEYLRALNSEGMFNEVLRRYTSGKFVSNSAVQAEAMRAMSGSNAGGGGYGSGRAAAFGESSAFGDTFVPQGSGAHAAGMGYAGGAGAGPEGPFAAANAGSGGAAAALTRGGTEKAPLHVAIAPSRTEIFLRLLSLGLFGFVIYTLLSAGGGKGGLLDGLTKGFNEESSIPDVRFEDVKGAHEAKEELKSIVDFLKRPEKYTSLGGKIPKGVLLTGPPGTGKTLLARAVAGEAGVPFFARSASEFEEMLVGLGASRVRKLFEAAREQAPCIIFIDEVDAIGGKRNRVSTTSGYERQTLNQMLASMDGFVQNDGVIVMAATNFPEALDAALTRPGRFDSTVSVPLPDKEGRDEIIQHYLGKVRVREGEVDVDALSRGTPGMSGADLESLINQAALSAAARDAPAITAVDLEDAKDKIMLGAARKSKVISRDTLLKTAYHEGGHTLVAMLTKGASPVHKTTILPRGQTAGVTYLLPTYKDEGFLTKAEILAQIDVAMGGRVAEEMIYGADEVTTGAGSDMQKASELARRFVKSFSMSKLGLVTYDSPGSPGAPSEGTQAVIDAEVAGILEESYQRATALLTSRRRQLDDLAQALLEHETLSEAEMRTVIAGGSLPKRRPRGAGLRKATGRLTPEEQAASGSSPDGAPATDGKANVGGAGWLGWLTGSKASAPAEVGAHGTAAAAATATAAASGDGSTVNAGAQLPYEGGAARQERAREEGRVRRRRKASRRSAAAADASAADGGGDSGSGSDGGSGSASGDGSDGGEPPKPPSGSGSGRRWA